MTNDTLLQINLGAGADIRPHFVNVDKAALPGIDVVHNIEHTPWPFVDDAAKLIVAQDIIEHLRHGLIPFMDEAWRVLAPDGRLFLRFPTPGHPQLWADPDHVRPYTVETVDYFDPETAWGKKYAASYTTRFWQVLACQRGANGNATAVLTPRKVTE